MHTSRDLSQRKHSNSAVQRPGRGHLNPVMKDGITWKRPRTCPQTGCTEDTALLGTPKKTHHSRLIRGKQLISGSQEAFSKAPTECPRDNTQARQPAGMNSPEGNVRHWTGAGLEGKQGKGCSLMRSVASNGTFVHLLVFVT